MSDVDIVDAIECSIPWSVPAVLSTVLSFGLPSVVLSTPNVDIETVYGLFFVGDPSFVFLMWIRG